MNIIIIIQNTWNGIIIIFLLFFFLYFVKQNNHTQNDLARNIIKINFSNVNFIKITTEFSWRIKLNNIAEIITMQHSFKKFDQSNCWFIMLHLSFVIQKTKEENYVIDFGSVFNLKKRANFFLQHWSTKRFNGRITPSQKLIIKVKEITCSEEFSTLSLSFSE